MIERLTLSFDRTAGGGGFIWRGLELAAREIFSLPSDSAICRDGRYLYTPSRKEFDGEIAAGVAAALAFFVEAHLAAIEPSRRRTEAGNDLTSFAYRKPWLKALDRIQKSRPDENGHWPPRLMGCMKDNKGAFCTVISRTIDFDRGPPIGAALKPTLLDPACIDIHINEEPASVQEMHAVAIWLVRTYLGKYDKASTENTRVGPDRASLTSTSTATIPALTRTVGESSTTALDRRRRILAVGFDAENVAMFVEADGKDVVLRRPEDPDRTARLAGHRVNVLCATVSKDGRYVLSGGADALRLWTIDPPAQVWFAERLGGWVTCTACSFAGDILLAGCITSLQIFTFDGDSYVNPRRASRPVSGEVRCVALSADGKLAFAGGRDMKVRHWKVDAPGTIELPAGHLGSVESVDCNQSGTNVLSGGADGSLLFCKNEQMDFKMRQPPAISRVCLSPDGRHAVVGDKEGVSFWNLKHHSLLARWPSDGAVRAIAFDYSSMHRVIFADDQAIYIRSAPVRP